jgi:hypothetical protein
VSFFLVNWGWDKFDHNSFSPLIFLTSIMLHYVKSKFLHVSIFCNDQSMSLIFFSLIYVLKFVLTTTLSRHICLFKVSIIIINSYLLCCSLFIQVHFKARFFFFNYASSPHVHNDVVYMWRNIWIFFWCGSIVGHAK